MEYYIAVVSVSFNDRKKLFDSVYFREKVNQATPIAEEVIKNFKAGRAKGEAKHINCYELDGDNFTVRIYPLPDDTPIDWVNKNSEIFLTGAAFKTFPHEWMEERVFCFSIGF